MWFLWRLHCWAVELLTAHRYKRPNARLDSLRKL